MARLPDVSVAIPLYRSAPFAGVVAANLDRLAGHVQITVSDATEDDDTLARLRHRFGSAEGITWLGRRTLGAGWVDHCNDIATRSDTEYLMWLPHDDDIDIDYVDACRTALLADPGLGAAVGTVVSVSGRGLQERSQPTIPPMDIVDQYRLPVHAYLAEWNLGLLFRALVRRSAWRPLPHTVAADEWADMVWGYGLALDWPIREVAGIVYRKRYHPASAHASAVTEFHPRGLPFLMRELVARTAAEDLAPAAVELVDVVTAWTADVVDERSRRAALLQERLDRRLTERVRRRATARLRRGR